MSARGIKNPNARKDVRRKQRILAQMIFGGSRDRMLEIAFGNQEVDFTKGADNSHLTRSNDIENGLLRYITLSQSVLVKIT